MNYYKRHLGDYARDTGHLSALEHGIYTLLLDWYYINECPIPDAKAKRIARGNPEETQTVLSEFFTETPDGWVHARADREIAEYKAKAATNREVGKLGGRPKKTQTVSEQNPDVTLATSHKPLAIKKEQEQELGNPPAADAAAAPILKAYHEILPACQAVAVLGPKRKRRIADAVKQAREVCREQGWPYDATEFWTAYFTECAADEWLRGDKPNPKNSAWRQKLDTLIDETRFTQVMDRAIAAMRGGK